MVVGRGPGGEGRACVCKDVKVSAEQPRPEILSSWRREDAEAIMKLYRHMVEKDPTEAATPDEMLEVYLYLHSLEKNGREGGELGCSSGKAENQILPAERKMTPLKQKLMA